jgi:hypothetical protein
MSKYDPLRDLLLQCGHREFDLTFSEIEKALGFPLPTSADRPQWWANIAAVPGPSQREAWRQAGYKAFLIAGSRRVKFRKVGPAHQIKAIRLGAVAASETDNPPIEAPFLQPEPATTGKPALYIADLVKSGFTHAATWLLSDAGVLSLDKRLQKDVGVYAFAKSGSVVYVGVATMGLAKRIYFYAKPGVSQKTSLRLNATIKNELSAGSTIDIYTAMPPDLEWNGLPIHGSAGLELGLIKKYELPWNMRSSG